MFYDVDAYLDWLDSMDREIDENICYWEIVQEGNYCSIQCFGVTSEVFPESNTYKFEYCPFCGRRIKIIHA